MKAEAGEAFKGDGDVGGGDLDAAPDPPLALSRYQRRAAAAERLIDRIACVAVGFDEEGRESDGKGGWMLALCLRRERRQPISWICLTVARFNCPSRARSSRSFGKPVGPMTVRGIRRNSRGSMRDALRAKLPPIGCELIDWLKLVLEPERGLSREA